MLLGLLTLASFFILHKSRLIFDESNIFFIKYFPIIFIGNGGILLFALGILFYKNFLVPYFSEEITKYEKAKNQICIFIFSIPIWISLSAYVFFESENKLHKILWCIFLTYFAWIVTSSAKILTKGRED
jgi:hypothetical protein